MIKLSWKKLKEFVADVGCGLNFVEDDFGTIYLSATNKIFTVQCVLLKDAVEEIEDFNTNYRASANMPSIEDQEGTTLFRPKFAPYGWHFQPRMITFASSRLGSVYSKKFTGEDIGDVSLRFYEAGHVAMTQGQSESDADFQQRLNGSCVETWMAWQAAHDYEIAGALFSIKEACTSPVWAWAFFACDIPAVAGGQVPYLEGGFNLEFIRERIPIVLDGRSSKRVNVDEVFGSNRMAIALKHNAGVQVDISIMLHFFRA